MAAKKAKETKEQLIQSVMKEDEKVLWQGQAEPFKTTNPLTKKGIWAQRIILGGLGLLAIYGTMFLLTPPMWAIALIVFLIVGFVMLLPISESKCIRDCDFIVTNERIMVMTGSRINVEFHHDDLNEYAIVDEEDGYQSVLIGEAVNCNPKERRKKTDEGFVNKDEEVTGVIFYNLSKENCAAVEKMLQDQASVTKVEVGSYNADSTPQMA